MSVEEFVEKALEKMIYSYHNVIQTKPHVVQGLQRMKEAGASLNILTASPHMILDKCLERLGLWEMFDNIWSSDDFGLKKSDPQIYREVAARLQKNVEDCIFVDDNIGAVTTAKKAGMYSVGVYDKFSEEYVAQMQAVADKYVFDFREL
jgi:HAD superfamily hydrolase (TIGR01509 family)